MLHKYRALLQHSEWRLRDGERDLLKIRSLLGQKEQEYQRLVQTMELQKNLICAAQPGMEAVSRQNLYAWLRRDAADRKKLHILRLDMQRQESEVNDSMEKIKSKHADCLKFERRCERYKKLLNQEKTRSGLIKMNADEEDVEERCAWKK